MNQINKHPFIKKIRRETNERIITILVSFCLVVCLMYFFPKFFTLFRTHYVYDPSWPEANSSISLNLVLSKTGYPDYKPIVDTEIIARNPTTGEEKKFSTDKSGRVKIFLPKNFLNKTQMLEFYTEVSDKFLFKYITKPTPAKFSIQKLINFENQGTVHLYVTANGLWIEMKK